MSRPPPLRHGHHGSIRELAAAMRSTGVPSGAPHARNTSKVIRSVRLPGAATRRCMLTTGRDGGCGLIWLSLRPIFRRFAIVATAARLRGRMVDLGASQLSLRHSAQRAPTRTGCRVIQTVTGIARDACRTLPRHRGPFSF
jgi:hypothetical protein